MGQCFPLPDDENVREAMQRHAENHEKIFNMYNFDLVPKPGSDMDKAQKLWDKKQVCCLSRLPRLLTCCAASLGLRQVSVTRCLARVHRRGRQRAPSGQQSSKSGATSASTAPAARK